MKFQLACILSLMACSAAALPASTKPGTIVQDTQGVELGDGEVCKATSTEGVLACNDASGASFNIVNGVRQKRSVAARSPKILTDSQGNKFDDSIFVVNGELIACPPNQQC